MGACDYRAKEKGSVTGHLAYVHDIGVKWHYCSEEGCEYRAKPKGKVDWDFSGTCRSWARGISDLWNSPTWRGYLVSQKVWDILFGPQRSETRLQALTSDQQIIKQLKAVNWFIHREEALIEYNELRAMPRKERRGLKLAA